jgi:outer membrane cobalamin receptor
LTLFSQTVDSAKVYPLEEVTIVANRLRSNTKDLFTRVEIFNSEQLKTINGHSLADKIKVSPSVFIKSYGHTSSLQTISINGLGAEHSVILLDGVRLNSFQNSMVDMSLISMDNIERIEILNNGSSAIYGSDAISGVVSLITKNKHNLIDTNSSGIDASLTYGSYKTYRHYLSFTKAYPNFSTNIFLTREKSAGAYDYIFDNGTSKIKKQRQNSNYDFLSIGLNSQIIAYKNFFVKLFSNYFDNFRALPGIEVGSTPTNSDQRDRNWNNIISLENIVNASLSLKTIFNYQNNLMNYYLAPNVRSYYKNIINSFSTDLTYEQKFLSSLIGYNFSSASLYSNQLEGIPNRIQHSIYFSSNYEPLSFIKLFPSLRYDYISDIRKNVITYKIGLNVKPLENSNLRLRGNIGNNFRAPTFNDLYWKEAGNRELQPETSFNKEFGLSYDGENIVEYVFDFTYTNIKAHNKIVWIPTRNFLWKPINLDESLSNSYLFTLSLSKVINKISLRLMLGYNVIYSIKSKENYPGDPTNGKFFPYLPLKSIKSNFSLGYDKISLNLFFVHYDKRYSDFENLKPLRHINLLDTNLSYELNLFNFQIFVKFEVSNLTNTDYQVIPGYPMPLRNYKLTFSINN